MGSPTRFTAGVATVDAQYPLGQYPFPDPFHTSGTASYDVVSYSNDFFTVGSTTLDWTITGTSSTFAITDGLGGVALVTPGGASTVTTVAGAHNGFQFAAGQAFWYLCRIKTNAVTSTKSFLFGLQTGTSATSTDGIWFTKPASSTSLNLVSRVGSTSTTLVTGVTTVAADTYVDVGFYYNGTDLLVYSGDALVSRVSAPTIGSSATTLTSALLTPVFQATPTATSDTLSIDYVLAAQETVR
jgi:hypothetical protein